MTKQTSIPEDLNEQLNARNILEHVISHICCDHDNLTELNTKGTPASDAYEIVDSCLMIIIHTTKLAFFRYGL